MPRTNPHKQAVNTRMLYRFEDIFFEKKHYKYLSKKASLKKLKTLAEHVWATEQIHKEMPTIQFGKGVLFAGQYVSFCNGQVIELAPHQRDMVTLLHELAHAAGNYLHNHKFVDTYVKFLVKYGEVDKKELLETMKAHNVDLPKKYK